MSDWRESQTGVEVSIVLVAPNTKAEDLPARALAYAGSALYMISQLREVRGGVPGLNIDTLRVMSPCHANVYANGGDLNAQIINAEIIRRMVEAYKNNFYPNLADMAVTLDVGQKVTRDVEEELVPLAKRLAQELPDVAEELIGVSSRYKRENGHDEESHQYRPFVYLMTHPPAWGYSVEEHLFGRNGENRLNFMPASELRYLALMQEVKGVCWTPAEDKKIVTTIAAKQQRAPYYPLWKEGLPMVDKHGETVLLQEPTLGDIAEGASLVVERDKLARYTGHPQVAEALTNLNQLKSDEEQANKRRTNAGVSGKTIPLGNLIRDVLGHGEK